MRLTELQKKLCNVLQEGLPIYPRPFAGIAKVLNSSEETILRQVSQLKTAGGIRRIGAVINYRALGRVSTLAAAHIPQESVQEVAAAINLLAGVSHNYLREHYYNLWFTLQAKSPAEIEVTLTKLSARFGIDFYNLPVERIFKLDVRFDAESEGQMSCDVEEVRREPIAEVVELNDNQKLVLSKLQNELEVIEKPFDFLCGEGLKEKDILRIITELIGKGVVRRVAAVVDHRKLGFIANVLFACEVPQERIVQAGKALACFGVVSHCYERKTIENWPYNLFAMMHGRSMGDVQHAIDKFVEAENIESFELLPTVAELKKKSVKQVF